MLAVSTIASVIYLASLVAILCAPINVTSGFVISVFRDVSVLCACIYYVVLGISCLLSVLSSNDSLRSLCKGVTQTLVSLLTILSLCWAGRTGPEIFMKTVQTSDT